MANSAHKGVSLTRPRIGIVKSEEGWYTYVSVPRSMMMFPDRKNAVDTLSRGLVQLFTSKVDIVETDLITGSRKDVPGGVEHLIRLTNKAIKVNGYGSSDTVTKTRKAGKSKKAKRR